MSQTSTTAAVFLQTAESWFSCQQEILVLIRYSRAAGAKDFEFFSSFQRLAEKIRELPSLTSVIVFKQPQLPLRGIVNDEFIAQCQREIRDGSEYLLIETAPHVHGSSMWYRHDAGASHAELQDDLEDSRGRAVAVGLYPQWLEDNEDVISATVPNEHGCVKCGIY